MKKLYLLLTSNFVLITLLIIVTVKEDYYQQILTYSSNKPYSYSDNWKYNYETDLYQWYNKKAKIVMLGNSITERCNWNELLNSNEK